MPLTALAKSIIEAPLPQDKIRSRPGRAGMTYAYVTPDFVIELLNRAFDYRWDTRIVYNAVHHDTAVVGLELTVYDLEGNPISKQQFGSCDMSRGMGPGEAFKGAASDALKKAATLLGVALELYQNDETPIEMGPPQFKRPTVPTPQLTSKSMTPTPAPAPRPVPAPRKSSAPTAPPRTPAPRPASAPRPVPAPMAPQTNPFDGGTSPPRPAPPASSSPAPPKPQVHPFGSSTEAEGPNSTQLNALVNLSQKKSLSPAEMIAKANVVDAHGAPKQVFEELTRSEAIQVIRAAQL